MRSRSRPQSVPGELLEFDPDVWAPEGGYEAWRAARLDYRRSHGDDTELGGIVTLLRKHLAVKRRLAGIRDGITPRRRPNG